MNFKMLAVCALAVAGCAAEPEERGPAKPGGNDPAPSERTGERVGDPGALALARVDINLARLRDLDVLEIGGLLVDLPEEASACYGPCPGSEPAIQDAKEEAALRLAELADVAEAAAAAPSGYLCTEQIDENLAALAGLEIVEVLGMIEVEPANNPQCYNLPCQADIDAANAENELRAAQLDSIARSANGM
jgi:hypothetical protein